MQRGNTAQRGTETGRPYQREIMNGLLQPTVRNSLQPERGSLQKGVAAAYTYGFSGIQG
jgi:hypothetical protein